MHRLLSEQRRRRWGKAVTNYRGRRSGRGPGDLQCSICFCLSWYYNYLLIYKFTPSDQNQVTLQMTVTLIDLEHSLLAGQPLMADLKTFFSAGLEPIFGVPAS